MLISSIKAVGARCFLALHALITVWRTTVSEQNGIFWLFLLVLLGVFVDLAFVLVKRKGSEWKWFSPSIFFYLATSIPCIWLLEMRRLEDKRTGTGNLTNSNETLSRELSQINPMLAKFASQLGNQFDGNQWVNFLEQAMLLVLIMACWMLPVSKEDISRDQLSQLLLVYLGLAADILELFAIFEEPRVLDERIFIVVILALWSWSLMQFTLVLTATRSRGFSTHNKVDAMDAEPDDDSGCFFCDGEVWSILIMCCMLDLPFLAIRLTAMILYRINTYTIYFFTCKNVLVVMLQGYRLSIVCHTQYKGASNRPSPAKQATITNGSENPIPSVELDMDMEMRGCKM